MQWRLQGGPLRTHSLSDQALPAKAALWDALCAHCDMSTVACTRCCQPMLRCGLPQVPTDLLSLAHSGELQARPQCGLP